MPTCRSASGALLVTQFESSDVLPAGSVAVAVTAFPDVVLTFLLKLTSPLASVVTLDEETKPALLKPVPQPPAANVAPWKNSIVKVVLAAACRLPLTTVPVEDASVGAAWSLLAFAARSIGRPAMCR